MNDATDGPLDYVTAHREAILDDLIAFASIPSVSTDPAYAAHIRRGGRNGSPSACAAAGLENVRSLRPRAIRS